MTCEILQKHPEGLKIYNDFKKAASFYIETEFNDIIPTYNEFISNKKIKEVFGIIPISKVKDEIGASFKKEISNQQLINLKKAISKTNDKIKDFVYLLFNVKQIGQADLYTWGLRKVKGNLDIQAKLDRAIAQATNTVQSNDKIKELQNKVNQQGIQGTLFQANNNNEGNITEAINYIKSLVPNQNLELVEGLINDIGKGSYEAVKDLITLSTKYANKQTAKHELGHKAFALAPKELQEKLLNEGSKLFGIKRGKSETKVKYSQAQQNEINYVLKAVDILQSDKGKQVFEKGRKSNWDLNKILTELQIPKEQKQLLLDLGITENKANVIIPIGTSGSGKSTFIKSLPQENLVVIEPDAMRVEFTGDMNDKSKDKEIYEEAAKRAVAVLKANNPIDVENLSLEERFRYYKILGIKKSDGSEITLKDLNENPTLYQLPQNRKIEEFVASEKTIRDLAARMSDRIGIPIRFESDRSKEYKGKLENGTAVINLAYATLDTVPHEVLSHSIIRALKIKSEKTIESEIAKMIEMSIIKKEC